MTEFKISAGETLITLNDEDFVLKPTIRAAQVISRQFNGFAAARQALVSENLDAVVSILKLGLNLSDKEARDLPDRVWKNGLTAELLIPLIKYVAILGNGGKPLPDDVDTQTSDEGHNQGNE